MPQLYTSRGGTIPDDVSIYEIDTLYAVVSRWGESILKLNRNKLYTLLSGSCSIEEYRRLFESIYVRYPSFTNDVDSICLFEEDPDLISKIIMPVRNLVDNYAERVMSELRAKRCIILMQTHDYIYVSSKTDIRDSYPYMRRIE